LGWTTKASLIVGTALSTTSLAVVYAVLVETSLNSVPLARRHARPHAAFTTLLTSTGLTFGTISALYAAYVEALRVERARDVLEDGASSLEAVAQSTGFDSAEVLRRAFHRRVGVSPAEYRNRFRLRA
jgi:AraC-like DNA-binding protein